MGDARARLRPVGALQDALPPPEVTAWLARRLAREYEEDEAATSRVALEHTAAIAVGGVG